MILVDNVTVAKYGTQLFKNLSIRIDDGENIVIQGRNGSGKSVLLELLAGKLHPQSGKVVFDFLDPDADWDVQHELRGNNIHYIPAYALHHLIQNHSQFYYQQRYYSLTNDETLTVRSYLGNDLSRLNALQVPPSFGVSKLLDVGLERLSNGQIKKIIIIKQLLRNVPKLLLFDYPFEGLDTVSRIELSKFIDDLHGHYGIQFVITDHYHHLPSIINRKLEVDKFAVVKAGAFFHSGSASDIKAATNGREAILPDPLQSPVIEMRDVTIQYGKVTVVENFNWRVRRGERWALTGKNGSGKTTIFSLIYADHPMAYSQAVYLFGRRRGTGESIWSIKERISYLGPEQIHFLDPGLSSTTPRSWILSDNKLDHDRLDSLASFFFADDYLDKPFRILSNGEMQMSLLIAFFLRRKELLLLDEPFQFLDPLIRER